LLRAKMTIGRLERNISEVSPLRMRPVHNQVFEVDAFAINTPYM
jgi:hypothetical protein